MIPQLYGPEGVGIVRGPLELLGDDSFRALFEDAARRPPGDTSPITTLRSVLLSDRPTSTTVGLTKYSLTSLELSSANPRQTITFYSDLLLALSRKAAEGVVAHELAHVWLNEHVRPEDSKSREKDADALARRWGFGPELEALDAEAETVN